MATLAGLLLGPTSATQALPKVDPLTVPPCFVSGEPKPPDLTATAALVIDAETGAVLYTKNADERLPMASTTKIMTAIIVLESLPLDQTVMVSRNAHFQSGSVVGLQAQEVVTVEQLLYGLLVFSGNDAAVALAEKTSGSETKFVVKMNERAAAMGLSNTHFTNASGLNAKEHYSSCTDLATMARYAMQNAVFREIVNTPVYNLPHPTRPAPRELKNSNALLTEYEWADGIKTGSTPWAGYCVVASGTREGVSLIVVLLGAVDDPTRWNETLALFQYGFSLCPKTTLAEPGRVVAEADLGDPLGLSVGLIPHQTLVARLWKGDEVTGTVSLSPDAALPIEAGDRLGSIEFSLDGVSLGSVDLFAQHTLHVPAIRDIVDHARNWYLPAFVLTERDGRHPR
jgi:D-alanyl-D-alanine carboxypeptidase (penicillin-binding protein 5/6)